MPTDDRRVHAALSAADIRMICEALDSYEYWELGTHLPRNNGSVFLPGDLIGEDYFWDGREPSAQERESIGDVQASRQLGARLASLLRIDE